MTKSVESLETRKRSQTLHTTLRPLFNLTLYCGMLPNWSDPQEISRARLTLSWIAVSLTMGTQIGMTLFQIIQLKIPLSSDPDIHSVTFNMLWLIPSVTSLLIQWSYVTAARSLVKFLREWRILEESLLSVDLKNRTKLVRGFFYGCTLSMLIATVISITFLITEKPDSSYLLTHYSFFRRQGTKPLTILLHMFNVFLMKTLMAVSDLVPSFFFYHVSRVMRALCDQIKSAHGFTAVIPLVPGTKQTPMCPSDASKQRIQSLRSNYNRVRKFVNEANGLFGPSMIVSLASKFCFLCLLSYKTLYGLSHPSGEIFVYCVNFFFFAYDTVSSVLLASQLKKAASDFRERFSDFVVDNWSLLSVEAKEAAIAFSHELQVNQLAVKPSNLFTVEPELLLSIGSLITTYVIILLQSD